jgi:rhodanese-related sulfurtransferase
VDGTTSSPLEVKSGYASGMKIATREDVADRSPATQLVEVLPEKEYGWAHLPGALSIPLAVLQDRAPQELDPTRPVITYCHDLYCDLGPRAASWLAHNGFDDVAEYSAGKMDWLSTGGEYEGSADLVGRHLEPALTCQPSDPIAAVADVLDASPIAVVVETDCTVIGVLSEKTLTKGGDACAYEVAEYGPKTVRPSEERDKLAARMKKRGLEYIVVSDRSGKLLGLYQPI